MHDRRRGWAVLALLAAAAGAAAAGRAGAPRALASQDRGAGGATARGGSTDGGGGGGGGAGNVADVVLARPTWNVGDTWQVETVTRTAQAREKESAGKPEPVRWKFRVAAVEKLAGGDCYRIEITCLSPGRVRPRSTLWCDAKSLMPRELRAQVAAAGRYQTIQESYDPDGGPPSPVLMPLNALPIDLPAFVPQGAKAAGTFAYVSQPVGAGAKDLDLVRFAHEVEQSVSAPTPKALEQVPEAFAKDIERAPVVEVRLKDHLRSVAQLWQEGRPWPVFADNGLTRSRLISSGREP